MRVNIIREKADGTSKIVGHFHPESATKTFNSNDERLYRTASGRWVIHDKKADYAYFTDNQASTWLKDNGHPKAYKKIAEKEKPRPSGRPKKFGATFLTQLTNKQHAWLKTQPDGMAQTIRNLIDAEILNQETTPPAETSKG